MSRSGRSVGGREEVVGLLVRHESDGGRYDTNVHRAIPLGMIIQDTRRATLDNAERFEAMWREEGRDDFADAVVARAKRMAQRRSVRYDESDFELAAEIYKRAFETGDSAPTRAVQEVMGLKTRRQASTLVKGGRDRGLLPPTEQRVARA